MLFYSAVIILAFIAAYKIYVRQKKIEAFSVVAQAYLNCLSSYDELRKAALQVSKDSEEIRAAQKKVLILVDEQYQLMGQYEDDLKEAKEELAKAVLEKEKALLFLNNYEKLKVN